MTNTTLGEHAEPATTPGPAPLSGRYRLGRVLGRGGAATVYEAFDLRLRRAVAIKVFRNDGDIDPDSARRFVDEAHLLAGLRHPGLVEIYDFGRTPAGPYLVLELIPGLTLQRRYAVEPLSPQEAARMGAALAHTLAYVHASGVVHRDMKPSNVLLDVDGRPRLADFGVSRTLGSAGPTRTGNVVGTAAYLAPEQVLGRSAEPPADVYALGLVIIESLNGAREYPGSPAAAAIARLHRPPGIPEGLPDDLARALREMTATEPADRPSAVECAKMLEGVVSAGTATHDAAIQGAAIYGAAPHGAAAHGAAVAGLVAPMDWNLAESELREMAIDDQLLTQGAATVWVPAPGPRTSGSHAAFGSEAGSGTRAGSEPRTRRRASWSMAALGVLAASGAVSLTAVPALGRSATPPPAQSPATSTATPARGAAPSQGKSAAPVTSRTAPPATHYSVRQADMPKSEGPGAQTKAPGSAPSAPGSAPSAPPSVPSAPVSAPSAPVSVPSVPGSAPSGPSAPGNNGHGHGPQRKH